MPYTYTTPFNRPTLTLKLETLIEDSLKEILLNLRNNYSNNSEILNTIEGLESSIKLIYIKKEYNRFLKGK